MIEHYLSIYLFTDPGGEGGRGERGATPLYGLQLYTCDAKEYGFLAILVWNRVPILTILVWNRVSFVHSSLELALCIMQPTL